MPNVIIYTTPTCGYCKLAKEFFKENNVTYNEIDVADNDNEAKIAVEKSGQTGVPVIEVDGKVIVGFQPDQLKVALGIA